MMHHDWYGLTSEDRVLHAGAFNWSFTLGTGLFDPWSVGATALVPQEGTPIEALPLLLKRHDATIFAAVPGVYRKLLRTQLPPLPKLRHGLSAGEKLPETIRTDWRAATGTDIHEAFGMTECSTFISGAPNRPAPANTLGYPQGGREIAILDDQGQQVPMGNPGRIAIARTDPGLMLGYLANGKPTPLDGDWFVSGDIGAISAEGAISYHGRADDVITAGGYRIAPLEIEGALLTHDEVSDAAAVDVEVKPGTRIIVAYVVGQADQDALRAHLARHLAPHKIPHAFVPLDALPRNANGKLLRKHLRDRPLDPVDR